MDLVALDFETASHRADSPCQVGVVVLEGGKILDERSWLIRPKFKFFSPKCVAVHGIRPEDVESQPEWDVIWGELQPLIEGRVVLAHNAGFDINVLVKTLALYDLAVPRIEFTCSRAIARRTWPHFDGFGLKAIADRLQIAFKHHDALEDARTSAMIALHAASHHDVASLELLEERLGLVRGRVLFGTVSQPKTLKRQRGSTTRDGTFSLRGSSGYPNRTAAIRHRRSVLDSYVRSCEHAPPFRGVAMVLHGTLFGLDRADSEDFLLRLGAVVQPRVTLDTAIVLVGSEVGSTDEVQASEYLAGEPKEISGAMVVREDVQKYEGQAVRVLSQRQWVALLPGGRSLARALAGERA